jgi:hypothetical protein
MRGLDHERHEKSEKHERREKRERYEWAPKLVEWAAGFPPVSKPA